MKLQIDTEKKTIKLDESIKIPELFNLLHDLLKEDIDNYTIETNCTINYGSYPIYIYPYQWKYYEQQPNWQYYQSPVTCGTSRAGGIATNTATMGTSVYNVEIKN